MRDNPQIYLGNIDANDITDMGEIFSGAEFFNQNINSCDVSNVIDMGSMFDNLPLQYNLSNINS